MNFFDIYNKGEAELSEKGIEDSRFDAMCLFEAAFSISRSQYYTRLGDEADSIQTERFFEFIKRRYEGEPLQYILEKWDFYKFTFAVGEGVLIPRPETAVLVEAAVASIKKQNYKSCLDLCAGSGCVGLSIALECPECEVTLLEKFPGALYYLRKNAVDFALCNVNILEYDIFDGYDSGKMQEPEIIVSNPPYIPTTALETLQAEVRREPQTALDGGEDGLQFYRCIKEKWADRLPLLCELLFECGEEQHKEITKIFSPEYEYECFKDMYNITRFIKFTGFKG